VIGPDQDPAGVGAQVVHPVGDRLASRVAGEVVQVDPLGLAGRLPLPPGVGEPADQLLVLGVHTDHRLGSSQVLAGLLVEVAELHMPVGMLGALLGLSGALQRVILPPQQPPDRVIADRMPRAVSASANSRVDVQVHRNGLCGSPPVSGSTSSSSAWSSPGSRSASRLGPPPGRRTRPRGSGGASSSRTPVYPVGRDSPLRRAIRAPPPRPRARAAAPASRRRRFSVRCGATSSHSPASTASTSTPRRYRLGMPPPQPSDKLVMRDP
jgi:hypothetical protein